MSQWDRPRSGTVTLRAIMEIAFCSALAPQGRHRFGIELTTFPVEDHSKMSILSNSPHASRITCAAMQLLLIASSAILAPTSVCAQEAPKKKPNILVIWGDDIGQFNVSAHNMGMMGYRTPNIDSIAREGAMFTDWYGQQSCTAGRAAFERVMEAVLKPQKG